MTDELRGDVKRILHQSNTPQPNSRIRKELKGSFPISAKDLNALLEEMSAAGDIFTWPQKKFWDRNPRIILPDLILSFMTKATISTASRIRTNLKLPLEMVESALNELVHDGKLFVWQPGKTAFFCLYDPRKTALEIILNELTHGPSTERELVGWVKKRLPGYQAKYLREHVSDAKQVYEHPKYGKVRTKYGLKPPAPEDYLGKALQEVIGVQKLLSPFHVSLEAIYEALGTGLGLGPKTRGHFQERLHGEGLSRDAEQLILQGIARLQPPGQRRALVSLRELRRSLSLTKSVFDQAVLSLSLKDKVALHHHDFPSSLEPPEREELVQDEQGTFYVGIVPREIL